MLVWNLLRVLLPLIGKRRTGKATVQFQPRGREGDGARVSVDQSGREVGVACQGGCKLVKQEMRVYHKRVCRVLRIIPVRMVRVDLEDKISSRGRNTRRWIVLCYGYPGVLPAWWAARSPVEAFSRGLGNQGKHRSGVVQVMVEKRRARGVS